MFYVTAPSLKVLEFLWTHFVAYFLVEALVYIIISRY
jgi:hypothetical protein